MMRSVLIYGGLLVASLGIAWARWTAEPTPDLDGQIILLPGDAEDIEKIVWKTEKDEAIIEQRSDELGSYLWVTYTKWKEVPVEAPDEPAETSTDEPAEASAEGEEPAEVAEPEMERVAEVQVFKAGDKGQELLDKLSPLMAIRRLDGVDDEKMEAIGLAEPSGSLQIVRKGRTTTLDVGGEAFGTRDLYLRNTDGGEIFLVDDETVRPLKYARTRLPDRTLLSLEQTHIASATLQDAGGRSLDILQKNAADTENAVWVRTSAPDAEDEQLNTWMEQAIKLKGSGYALPDEQPDDLQPQFTLTLTTEGGDSQTLEVLREGEDGDWWGRSEHTRGLIKLLKGPGKSLADDVSTLLDEP